MPLDNTVSMKYIYGETMLDGKKDRLKALLGRVDLIEK
jgi:hypothetical protein